MRSARILIVAAALLAMFGGEAWAPPKRFQEGAVAKPALPAPDVWLYTFGVGPVIFEKFGHSALCLDYHDAYPTVCFNYGVTDFGAGAGLIWGFLRSQQKFWVEPVPLRHLEYFYRGEDRDIWKQKLQLSEAQSRGIEDHLWGDLDEKRRYYYYDHFYDNCTTRLRDMIDQATDGALKRDTVKMFPRTFRAIGASGLAEFPPLIALSDFMVGRDLDHYPDYWAAMFLPDLLRIEVERRLNAPAERVYTRRGPPFPTEGPSDRGWVILIALGFTLPLVIARLLAGRRVEAVVRVWALVPLVFFGLFIWVTVILCTIPGVRWNEAAFLFVPTDVALLFLGEARRRGYARIRVAMVAVVSILLAIGIFKQPLSVPALVAFMPLALIAFDLPPRRAARAAAADAADLRASQPAA